MDFGEIIKHYIMISISKYIFIYRFINIYRRNSLFFIYIYIYIYIYLYRIIKILNSISNIYILIFLLYIGCLWICNEKKKNYIKLM